MSVIFLGYHNMCYGTPELGQKRLDFVTLYLAFWPWRLFWYHNPQHMLLPSYINFCDQ